MIPIKIFPAFYSPLSCEADAHSVQGQVVQNGTSLRSHCTPQGTQQYCHRKNASLSDVENIHIVY